MPHGQTWFSYLIKALGYDAAALADDPNAMRSFLAHSVVRFEHVAAFLAVLFLLLGLALIAQKRLRDTKSAVIPEAKFSAATFFELLVGAVYNGLISMMGKKAARFFLPLIGTCALMILFSNAMGLIPGLEPPTNKLNTTLAMSGVVFFSTHIFGVKQNGIGYFKHFFGPYLGVVAIPINLLIFAIEIISHCVRPVSLAFRLMLNMFVDHVVAGTFLMLAGLLFGAVGLKGFGVLLPVPLLMLGSLVIVLQTVVFCMLSAVYIAMAIEHHEEHAHH